MTYFLLAFYYKIESHQKFEAKDAVHLLYFVSDNERINK